MHPVVVTVWTVGCSASKQGFEIKAKQEQPAVIGRAVLVSESREVMNVRQASQYLGISPDTLYRYITEGEIPAFKLGNRWKLRKTILDRWMERKMSQSAVRRR
jgi:excisionase family DNA binding protein